LTICYFNDTLPAAKVREHQVMGRMRVVDWKGYGMKQSLPILIKNRELGKINDPKNLIL
jgi:hypothetical protein